MTRGSSGRGTGRSELAVAQALAAAAGYVFDPRLAVEERTGMGETKGVSLRELRSDEIPPSRTVSCIRGPFHSS